MYYRNLKPLFSELATPFYFYDTKLLDSTLGFLSSLAKKYEYTIHYALKANSNPSLLKRIQSYGFGADCVSGNEIKRAIELNFSPSSIVFAGVGKSDQEIEYAINQNISCFNCESIQELEVINEIAVRAAKIASVAFRINPDVEAKTHQYITTGTLENKFGISIAEFKRVVGNLRAYPNIKFAGLHFHIGSQITDFMVFEELCIQVNRLLDYCDFYEIKVPTVNLGGGLGVNYEDPDRALIPDFESFFNTINKFLKRREGQKVCFEFGRSIVAQCGSLLTKVLYVKKNGNTTFLIVDAGFTELIRPALYQAYHSIESFSEQTALEQYDVVGPICESADFFARNISLRKTQRGDLLMIRSVGAYGEIMQSKYNLRTLAKSYDSFQLIEKEVEVQKALSFL